MAPTRAACRALVHRPPARRSRTAGPAAPRAVARSRPSRAYASRGEAAAAPSPSRLTWPPRRCRGKPRCASPSRSLPRADGARILTVAVALPQPRLCDRHHDRLRLLRRSILREPARVHARRREGQPRRATDAALGQKSVYADEDTRRAILDGSCVIEALEPIKVKGKEELVPIYRPTPLQQMTSQQSRLARTQSVASAAESQHHRHREPPLARGMCRTARRDVLTTAGP